MQSFEIMIIENYFETVEICKSTCNYFEIIIIGNYIETVEACKSAYKSVCKYAYKSTCSVSEFGRTRNY